MTRKPKPRGCTDEERERVAPCCVACDWQRRTYVEHACECHRAPGVAAARSTSAAWRCGACGAPGAVRSDQYGEHTCSRCTPQREEWR